MWRQQEEELHIGMVNQKGLLRKHRKDRDDVGRHRMANHCAGCTRTCRSVAATRDTRHDQVGKGNIDMVVGGILCIMQIQFCRGRPKTRLVRVEKRKSKFELEGQFSNNFEYVPGPAKINHIRDGNRVSVWTFRKLNGALGEDWRPGELFTAFRLNRPNEEECNHW